jgi:hypothetical protein
VTGFFKKGDRLEGKLRAARPQPSDELVSRIEARISETRPSYRRSSFRYAVPAALTIAMISALAAVGGVSYAASSVAGAVHSVAKVFAPAKISGTLTIASATSGGDQYKPGYGWGDDDHNHEGPPGLKKKQKDNGEFAPPLTTKVQGKTATVSTDFTIDEQAHLFISVIDLTTDKQLLISQSKSTVGKGVKGKAAKNIDYQVLVPRTIPLKLALPANLVLPGRSYAIQVIARDPNGNKSKLLIPFKG